MAIFHVSSECEKPGHFYICHPSHVSKPSIKETWILISRSHNPTTSSIHWSVPRKIHSNMAGLRRSASCSRSPKPGDWEKCSILHSQLVELQTQGFLPPAYMVPVRTGLATYNGVEQGGVGMPCPLLIKGTWISNPSVPPRALGVLWPPVA